MTVGNGPSGVAFGEGAIWVTNSADGTVSRISPRASRVTKTFPAVIGASGVAVGFGRVWIVSPSSASVVALDPHSGEVLKRIGVGVEPNAVAVGGESVWVANRADDTVSKIDAQTASVRDLIPVGRGPEGIAADARDVWVANGGDGTMTRLDPASGDIAKTVVLDNPPRGVTLTPNGVYVAVQSTGIEHRGGALRVLLVAEAVESIDPGVASFSVSPVLLVTNDGLVGFRRVGGVEGAQLVPISPSRFPRRPTAERRTRFRCARAFATRTGNSCSPRTSSVRSNGSSLLARTAVPVTTAGSSGPIAAPPGSRVISRRASPRTGTGGRSRFG